MKKLPKVTLFKSKQKQEETHERITNETVAQHREKILAGGRRFKYPVQYAHHKLVINTVIVTVFAFVVFAGVIWWQLYSAQNTGAFFYRLTQLAPLPVASVNGYNVPYSDYLMQYRSSVYWLESKSRIGFYDITSEDGKRQAAHFKRQSLNKAIENAYAQKLAEERGITVTEAEIDDFIDTAIQSSSKQSKLSGEAYESVLSDSLGVSVDEYRLIVKQALLKQKIAFLIDEKAKISITTVRDKLHKSMAFEKAVEMYSDEELAKTTKGDVGFVPKTNQDQGLVQAALKLKPGKVSPVVKTNDGYYVVKLLQEKGDQVRYARLKISLTEFDSRLAQLKKDNKITEYIDVPKT